MLKPELNSNISNLGLTSSKFGGHGNESIESLEEQEEDEKELKVGKWKLTFPFNDLTADLAKKINSLSSPQHLSTGENSSLFISLNIQNQAGQGS